MIRMSIVTAATLCAALLVTVPVSFAAQEQSSTATAAASAKQLINLNAATLDQLETLPGIGRKTAERILEFRTKNGGFKRIEDLMNVKGIGEKSFLKLKPLIAVKPAEKTTGD